jgi:hypothetical protein
LGIDEDVVALRLTMLLHDTGKFDTSVFVSDEYGYSFHRHEKHSAVIATQFCERMKIDSALSEAVIWGVANHMAIPGMGNDDTMQPTAIRRWARKMGKWVGFMLDIRQADGSASSDEGRDIVEGDNFAIEDSLAHIPVVVKLPVNGNDVMKEAGIGPGPQVGAIMRSLEHYVDIFPSATRDELLGMIRIIAMHPENIEKEPETHTRDN